MGKTVQIIPDNQNNNSTTSKPCSNKNITEEIKMNGFESSSSHNNNKKDEKKSKSHKSESKHHSKNKPVKKLNGQLNNKNNDTLKKRGRSSKDSNSNNSVTSSNSSSNSNNNNNNSVYYDPNKIQKNPFLLVDYHRFSDDLIAPLNVKIKLDALALMDLHSHCVHTEVIGCLGGYYCKVTKTLHVLATEPCFSIDDRSTTCEMDPVSQALAFEKLEAKNLNMVGWYHSHPTFSPNPSFRDMDTQNYFQNFFNTKYKNATTEKNSNSIVDKNGSNDNNNEQKQDDNPFVAFIISPFMAPSVKTSMTSKSYTRYQPIVEHGPGAKFYANNTVYKYLHPDKNSYCYFTHEVNSILASSIKCFWVGDCKYAKTPLPTKKNLLIPYEIDTIMIRDENFIPSITNRLSEMCQRLFQDQSKTKTVVVDLLKRYTRIGSINVTYLEKLIASISHHLQNPSVAHLCTEYESERIRQECASILMQELIINQKNGQSTELKKRRIE